MIVFIYLFDRVSNTIQVSNKADFVDWKGNYISIASNDGHDLSLVSITPLNECKDLFYFFINLFFLKKNSFFSIAKNSKI